MRTSIALRDEQLALYDEYAKRHGMRMKTLWDRCRSWRFIGSGRPKEDEQLSLRHEIDVEKNLHKGGWQP